MQEDHVSMGWGAARKLRAVVANLTRVARRRAACAGRGGSTCAPRWRRRRRTAAALSVLRSYVPGPGPDRYLAPELAAVEELVRSGVLVDSVEAAIGPLR